ncbi:hypothetical protein EV646_1131, partial [Kribbella antiqua]
MVLGHHNGVPRPWRLRRGRGEGVVVEKPIMLV